MPVFTGIPPEAFQFLLELRFNNNREWFQAHKSVYLQQVKQPVFQLCAALSDAALQMDPMLEVRPERVVSRIYRDARRLRGRPFYRDEVWFSYWQTPYREGHSFHFYFYMNPDDYGWGCGFYDPNVREMDALRRRILNQPDTFRALICDPRLQGYTLHGPDYKRPKGTTGDALLDTWYNKKSISLSVERPVDARAFSPALLDELQQALRDFTPIYHFIHGMNDA